MNDKHQHKVYLAEDRVLGPVAYRTPDSSFAYLQRIADRIVRSDLWKAARPTDYLTRTAYCSGVHCGPLDSAPAVRTLEL